MLNQWKKLQRLLARGDKANAKVQPLQIASEMLGLKEYNAIPALLLAAQGVNLTGRWICVADPVNVQPTRDHISIMWADFSDMTHQESSELLTELNLYFAEDGYQFYALPDGQWCFASPHSINARTQKARDIVGQNIMQYMPGMSDKSPLTRLFTDIQLMLHHAKTNKRRADAGKLEVNALWLRDETKQPVVDSTETLAVYSIDPGLNAVAHAGKHTTFAQCISANDLSSSLSTLCYIPRGNFPELFSQAFFEEIYLRLNAGELDQMRLITANHQITISRAMLKRFWKNRFTP